MVEFKPPEFSQEKQNNFDAISKAQGEGILGVAENFKIIVTGAKINKIDLAIKEILEDAKRMKEMGGTEDSSGTLQEGPVYFSDLRKDIMEKIAEILEIPK
jgi:hypothetical protein